ncbi:MAG TPA: tripartite tricarboxylate transporter permease [Burkholderiaceae bacterium]|jgi:putative tricarboxylic transport membrane protein|nr:tripartite tricarboxylate transporter permease [Burkholderiaceae bacterium]HPE01392.1 tripartite tricarboxylate transporter permease [Burkholderiaceae bacterium]HRZ00531.1 tripartite tricarboxylate transporter permease [Burkholderiaceae bacterium]
MEGLSALMEGFAAAVTPMNLLWAFVGATIGTAIGVLPGIGPALTIAMLLPVTAKIEPTGALIMFAGVYYGAMFGGSTTSILLNTPGESASLVTALEGNAMAKRGQAAAALATAAIGSFLAGTVATLLLSLFAPYLVDVALKFGPAEYFAIMVLAFTTVSALMGKSALRGMTSLFAGLAVGMVGIEATTGQARFTVGLMELTDGIDVVLVAVGLFAVGEALYNVIYEREGSAVVQKLKGSMLMTREQWARSWKPWLRGTLIGFPFGSIPAGGAEIPTFLSYSLEKKLSKHPEEFGKGAIEGVAGPEATNNAAATGTLVPLLTLGIPTTATAAMLLAAFQNYNLQPGPLLFEMNPALVWGLIASLYIGNLMLLVLNLPLAGVWARLLAIPRPMLYAGILVFAALGAYTLRQSTFDLALLLLIGLLGVAMRRYDFPTAPVIVGMILGPLAEKNFRNALSISQGDFSVFATRPIAATILVIALAVVLVPRLTRVRFGHADD